VKWFAIWIAFVMLLGTHRTMREQDDALRAEIAELRTTIVQMQTEARP
jgi:hypothetical protein